MRCLYFKIFVALLRTFGIHKNDMIIHHNLLIRPNKNISVVRVTCQKKLGRVGREKKISRFFLY